MFPTQRFFLHLVLLPDEDLPDHPQEGSNEEGMWRAAAEAEARLMSAINAFQSMLGVKAP